MFANKTFIGYARVSTKDQAKKGSYKIQLTNMNKFCQENQIVLEKIYLDKGKHGWDLESDEFRDMLNHLEKVNGLIIEHNDRFFRGDPLDPTSMIDALNLYREIFKKGKIVYSIQEGELRMKTLMDVFMMSVRTFTSSDRILVDKTKQKQGIKRVKKEKGSWGRQKKTINLKQYEELRTIGMSKTDCARWFGISKPTLNRILRENNNKDFGEFKSVK